MSEFQPPTWLSRSSTLENGVWWKVCTVLPFFSAKVTVTMRVHVVAGSSSPPEREDDALVSSRHLG